MKHLYLITSLAFLLLATVPANTQQVKGTISGHDVWPSSSSIAVKISGATIESSLLGETVQEHNSATDKTWDTWDMRESNTTGIKGDALKINDSDNIPSRDVDQNQNFPKIITIIPVEADIIYPQRYKVRSLLLSYPTLKDEFLSPLTYYGFQLGMSGSTIIRKLNWIGIRNYSAQLGLLQNYTNESSLFTPRLEFDYSYLRYLYQSPSKKLNLYAGGLYNLMLLGKYLPQNVNNIFSYDVATALHTSGRLSYQFTLLGKDLTITNQLSIPLIGILLRPEYAWPTPYFIAEKEANISESIRLAYLGNYFRLQNHFALYFQTSKSKGSTGKARSNYWRLSYMWDYHQISLQNLTQSASHIVSFGRVLKF